MSTPAIVMFKQSFPTPITLDTLFTKEYTTCYARYSITLKSEHSSEFPFKDCQEVLKSLEKLDPTLRIFNASAQSYTQRSTAWQFVPFVSKKLPDVYGACCYTKREDMSVQDFINGIRAIQED